MLQYRRLQKNEIRVIKLLTEEDDPRFRNGPVHCELEYVGLEDSPISPQTDKKELTKGFNGYWPAPIVEEIEIQPRVRGRANSNALWSEYHVKRFRSGFRGELASSEPFRASHTASASSSTANNCIRAPSIGSEDFDLPWRYSWGDYVALSYVWGDSSPSAQRQIYVNGYPLAVTQNLEAALQQLRKHYRIKQGFRIWIDAICINQADLAERGSQVAMMKRIYDAAWHVVIWLGPKSGNSDVAMMAVRYFSLRSKLCADPMEGLYKHIDKLIIHIPGKFRWRHRVTMARMRPSVYRAIYRLLCRPYFRRLWILQEAALGARNMPVLCGDRCVQADDIYRTVKVLQSNASLLGRDLISCGHWWRDMQGSWGHTGGDAYGISEKLWERPVSIFESQDHVHAPTSLGNGGIFNALLLGRESHASDERDRIYGILGLKQVAAVVQLVPDYNLTAIQVFTLFSQRLCASGDLNGLRLSATAVPRIGTRSFKFAGITRPKKPKFVHHHRSVNIGCIHTLPSWIICWSCPPNPAINIPGYSSPLVNCPTITPLFQEEKFMTVKGIIFDSISSLSAFHTTESDASYPLNGPPVASVYGDQAATNEAFWRTIVANRTRSGETAPDSYGSLLRLRILRPGPRKYFQLDDFIARNKKMRLFDRHLGDLFPGAKKHPQYINPPIVFGNAFQEHLDATLWAMRVLAWRRLIITQGGYLGLAPASSMAGDIIAVLPGCPTPLVLRREGERFRVIGEAYVHGIMSGELQEMLEQGKRKMVDITLC
ncbi:heterokaryon incompatibility protein [Rutstroemia sp. NJR-2017a BVV2]|nr:heterokaryon incompatibility protein [Rutstroemia sp. NJR-2017a BVV2]PQE09397.1 heterokaryon incompatibility protein [Rutstroemia sp. NJR-2017a BVV2]